MHKIFELLYKIINCTSAQRHKYKQQFIAALNELEDINIRNIPHTGKTLLITAADYAETDIIEILLNKGADLELTDDYNRTAFLCACYRALTYEKDPSTKQSILKLLEYKPNVNHKDNFNNTGLSILCTHYTSHFEDIVLEILNRTKDANEEEIFFMLLCRFGTNYMPEVQKRIISLNAHITRIKKTGAAMEFENVCRQANIFLAEELLKNGADVSVSAIINIIDGNGHILDRQHIFKRVIHYNKIITENDDNFINCLLTASLRKHQYIVDKLFDVVVKVDAKYDKVIEIICVNKMFFSIDKLVSKIDDSLITAILAHHKNFAMRYIEHCASTGKIDKIYSDNFIKAVVEHRADKAIKYIKKELFMELFRIVNKKNINKYIGHKILEHIL
jgi:hypothetical protein